MRLGPYQVVPCNWFPLFPLLCQKASSNVSACTIYFPDEVFTASSGTGDNRCRHQWVMRTRTSSLLHVVCRQLAVGFAPIEVVKSYLSDLLSFVVGDWHAPHRSLGLGSAHSKELSMTIFSSMHQDLWSWQTSCFVCADYCRLEIRPDRWNLIMWMA